MHLPNRLRTARLLKVIMAALFVFSSAMALAQSSPGYSHDEGVKTSNPSWMTALNDDTLLSSLSLPGTHDSLARHGGDSAQTQSMSLSNQLESGIRVLDVRCRQNNDNFRIYHGITDQHIGFDDVLTDVIAFLKTNPNEAVFMRVKEETPRGDENKLSFEDVFKKFWSNTSYSSYFWTGTYSTTTKLSDVRGKIVVLDNFSASGTYGIHYTDFNAQDQYVLHTNWDLYEKWTDVKEQLAKANTDTGTTLYINYLSASTGSFPYFVASGHSSSGTSAKRLLTGKTTPGWKDWKDFPRVGCAMGICSIAFEGTNNLTYERLGTDFKTKVGAIMADFPGPGLIERIIALNDQF